MSFRIQFVVLLLLATTSVLAEKTDTLKTTSKLRKEFVVKMTKDFLGAKVEVISADGHIIATDSLQRRRLIIDFREARHGSYLIRFTKGSRKHQFQYSAF